MSRLLAVFLLAVHTLTTSAFYCPNASAIMPCECWPRGQTVFCNRMNSFTHVNLVLGPIFQGIPRLILNNIHTSGIPEEALGAFQVDKLEIRDSILNYVVQDAFGPFQGMNTLVLENDRLRDFENLLYLSELEVLDLSENLLTRIHNRSLSHLGRLMHLTLSGNQIAEIAKDAFPKNVNIFAITRNHLSTFNGSLQSLEILEELYASYNRFTSIKGEFDGTVRLKKLVLDHNQISDISDSFLNLTSLQYLNLAGNRIQELGKSLWRLEPLRTLNLAHNNITKFRDTTFKNLNGLRYLDLSGNFVSRICPSLNSLNLRSLKLSDMGLEDFEYSCLFGMRELMSLDLSHNQFSALRHQIDFNNNLRYLDISFNNFTNLRALHLPANTNLVKLKMDGNYWRCSKKMMWILRDLEGNGYEFHGYPDC